MPRALGRSAVYLECPIISAATTLPTSTKAAAQNPKIEPIHFVSLSAFDCFA